MLFSLVFESSMLTFTCFKLNNFQTPIIYLAYILLWNSIFKTISKILHKEKFSIEIIDNVCLNYYIISKRICINADVDVIVLFSRICWKRIWRRKKIIKLSRSNKSKSRKERNMLLKLGSSWTNEICKKNT